MKATIEFNCEEPEDAKELRRCVKNIDLALTIWDMDEWIRSVWRSKIEKPEGKEWDDWVRDEWMEILERHDINLDNLIS